MFSGKPDAGNLPVRFEEGRGGSIGLPLSYSPGHFCRDCGPCRLARQDRKIERLERKWKTDQTPAGLVPAGESDCPAIAAESRSPAGRAGRGPESILCADV